MEALVMSRTLQIQEDGDGGTSNQDTPYGITRVNGVANYTGNNVAWILDSGVDLDHPDLNVDASRAFNAFTSGRDGKSADDGNGHGTHVAGTIAALNNDIGVIGVAPGAVVIPVKVLDSRGSGSYSGVIAGVDWVGANGQAGDVANMSLGGPVSQALDDAVVAASSNGVIFALAAGNESSDANNSSPARANGPNIVTISAMDVNDNWASFSNYGNPPVDYAAPGVAVKSTWKDGGYNTISGTSMAAPHAAGVLLLGAASTDGTVNNDPDGNADPIIVH
jgi:subtilisin family serine protease